VTYIARCMSLDAIVLSIVAASCEILMLCHHSLEKSARSL
jgi:hypothetical protein